MIDNNPWFMEKEHYEILEDWLKIDAVPIVDGQFEKPEFIHTGGNAA